MAAVREVALQRGRVDDAFQFSQPFLIFLCFQLWQPLEMIVANARWEQFAQRVASGDSASAAYRAAYGAKQASAEAAGSRLLRNVVVSSRVAELRKQAGGAGAIEEAKVAARVACKVVLTLAKKRELLHALATARKLDVRDRLRAIELDAKLAGELKGDSVTVNATAVASGYALTEEKRADLMARRRAALEANGAAEWSKFEEPSRVEMGFNRLDAL